MSKKKIIIGTAIYEKNYGILNSKNKSIKTLNKLFLNCYKNGIRHFDLAPSYGNVEKNFGKIFGNKIIQIDTKITKIISKKNIQSQLMNNFKKTLNDLQRDKINTLYVHDFENFLKYKSEYNLFFKFLKKEKKIKNIGFSIYKKLELVKLLKIFHPDIVQVPLNLFNQSFNTPEVNFLKKKFKFKIYARSIFLQGVLLSSKDNLPKNLIKYKKLFSDYEKFLIKNKIGKLDACLNFVKNSFFDRIIIGFESKDQLNMILDTFKNRYNKKINFKRLNVKFQSLIDPRKWQKI